MCEVKNGEENKMHVRLQNDVSMQLSGNSPQRDLSKFAITQLPAVAQFCHEKRILHWPVKLKRVINQLSWA